MEKELKIKKSKLYHKNKHGEIVDGPHSKLTGNISRIYGDCSNIRGDASNIWGDVSSMYSDVTYTIGDVSNLRGFEIVKNYIKNIVDIDISDLSPETKIIELKYQHDFLTEDEKKIDMDDVIAILSLFSELIGENPFREDYYDKNINEITIEYMIYDIHFYVEEILSIKDRAKMLGLNLSFKNDIANESFPSDFFN